MMAYVGQTRSLALIAELEKHGIGECVVCGELPALQGRLGRLQGDGAIHLAMEDRGDSRAHVPARLGQPHDDHAPLDPSPGFRQAALRDYKISAVILGVVRSVPFEMRRSES